MRGCALGNGRSIAGPPVQCHSCLRVTRSRRHLNLNVKATAAPELAEELTDEKRDIQKMLNKPYKYGFKTIIESDVFPKGLSEDVVRAISAKKEEPEWLLDYRYVQRRSQSSPPPTREHLTCLLQYILHNHTLYTL